MKRVTAALIMMLACSIAVGQDANEPEKDKAFTFWLSGANLAYQNTNVNLWTGLRWQAKENIDLEMDLALSWREWTEADNPEDTQSQFGIGIASGVHLKNVIEIPNPFAGEIGPATIAGEPFFFLEYIKDTEGRGDTFSPIVGARIFDAFAAYYKYLIVHGEDVDDQGLIGISAQYRF